MDSSHPHKRQRWTKGAVLRIPLGNSGFAFAQMLEEPEYAFFAETRASATPQEAVTSPVLFRLWVTRRAHSTGRWKKIGAAPVAPALSESVLRFNQDPQDPARILLGYDGVSGKPCTAEECRGFERAAVWEPEHVEERLGGVRLSRESVWAQRLAPDGP